MNGWNEEIKTPWTLLNVKTHQNSPTLNQQIAENIPDHVNENNFWAQPTKCCTWQGWMTYCACPRHHCLPSEQRSRGAKRREGCTRRQWNSPEKTSIYFSIHLWELKNEKFYKYVSDACLRKKWLVNRIKEAIFDLGDVFHCFDRKLAERRPR